jgi:hypothetical protein
MQPAAPPDAAAAPRWARRFVAAYLAVFVVCGLAGFEAWPLTGWRLFADARQPVQPGWQAVTVDRAGRETPVPFRELPVGYQGHVQVFRGFPGLPPDRRVAVCQAWAEAVRARGGEVAAVRLYQTETDVSRRVGRRGAPPHRTLRYSCRDGTVEAVDAAA